MAAATGASIVIDDAALSGLLARLEAAGAKPAGLTHAIAAALEFQTQRRFETETDPAGVRWQPSFAARKRAGQTLTDTARLRQSITASATASEAMVGTNLVYAAIHNFGGTIHHPPRTVTLYRSLRGVQSGNWRFVKKRASTFASDAARGAYDQTVPQRQFIGWSPRYAAVVGEAVRDWLHDVGLPAS